MEGIKEDVLTVALMSKEHPGRVRAVGSHITPTVYFTIPKQKGCNVQIFLAQQDELMETKETIQELEDAVFKMNAQAVDMNERGSCSVKSEHNVKISYAEPARNLSRERKPDKDDDDDVQLVDTLDALQVYLETLLLRK